VISITKQRLLYNFKKKTSLKDEELNVDLKSIKVQMNEEQV
jgi:hypothetical protein